MSTPWAKINTPQSELMTRRVNDSGKWEFFWAKDTSSKFLFIYRTSINPYGMKLPSIDGICVELKAFSDGNFGVALILIEKVHAELFETICLDIINESENVPGEKDIPALITGRLKMWQSLLKKAKSKILTPDQQRGLIAEVKALTSLLLPKMEEMASLEAWLGPDKESHDFVFGNKAIEVKSRTSRSNSVMISSERQLYHDGFLYLYTLIVDATSDIQSGCSLNEFVDETCKMFSPDGQEVFRQKLFQAGYLPREEYGHTYYSIGESSIYAVDESFPKITIATIPGHIGSVKYSIDMAGCSDWKVDVDEIINGN
ncbi:PD-(D/E)XK motif protein [Alcanivorax sp. IL3]|uniref:PD-(D/E)XK motif protein n=1 Tax=unclassified Alcanivorax TaxID=2638842 RepID=UPI000C4940D2|nr:hypothetical protein [Alcanivorax sp.]|tara:strand:+ start:3805 stop:4749 length:945 start_codon:yes stop_codon:yes gene_type:complete